MNDHPYADPARWPTDKRGLRAVRVYFEALELMHRCRALELQLAHRPAVTAEDVARSAWADALSP